MHPSEALRRIKLSKNVLSNWKKYFDITRNEIEKQTVHRWEFQPEMKEIFATPLHMVDVLDDLEVARTIQEQFYAILGPELMKVTGDFQKIDEEKSKIKNLVLKLVNFPKDIFNENHKTSWTECYRRFNESIIGSDNGVKMLIEETFSESLTSSESAFDLLSNF
jgi:uncharacterized protein YnzC (UPF0291/DUF896 family)